jgi:hypothetical protein
MDFREKIEFATAPLVKQLKDALGRADGTDILVAYQMSIDLAQEKASHLPDGFIMKWRYMWALMLASPLVERKEGDWDKQEIDALIENIFDVYNTGAVREPGKDPKSEKEFLTRLGLAIRVREPDVLAFPEQIRDWALTRFEPFNDQYFLPSFGLRAEEIFAWVGRLLEGVQTRLNALLDETIQLVSDLRNAPNASGAQKDLETGKLSERLRVNAKNMEMAHTLSATEMQNGISESSASSLSAVFGISFGEVPATFVYPHDENPLEYKMFVHVGAGRSFFLDPASSYRIMAKTFEQAILKDEGLRERYLRVRDQATEQFVCGAIQRSFPNADVHANYYAEKGSFEKDIFVRQGESIILIECKNSRVRQFKGRPGDLLKFEEDFENSIQYSYNQALDAKRRILAVEECFFYDSNGSQFFSVRRAEIKNVLIVCVAATPRGPLGTDMSYLLDKANDEPFPLAISRLDLETLLKHIPSFEGFVDYLLGREKLHGRVRTGDELNYAGYFLTYGNLDFRDGAMLGEEYSALFDRAWFREKGLDVKEPPVTPPQWTSINRSGDVITIEHPTGRKEVIRLASDRITPPATKLKFKMKGSDRNIPCPCGSGLKFKRCHGL